MLVCFFLLGVQGRLPATAEHQAAGDRGPTSVRSALVVPTNRAMITDRNERGAGGQRRPKTSLIRHILDSSDRHRQRALVEHTTC
ncbi:hypothetical protein M8494_11490 [Serratia ureilytica]